jgi:putative oxidoreductase
MFDFAGRPLRAIHSSWRSIDTATLIMRAALGVGFVAHGGQKLFGWFGGTGITGTTAFFNNVGLPAPHAFAYVSGILEFFGGIVIALGFLTVPAAFALVIEMIIAVATVSYKAGFFVTAQKIGWELNVYLLGLLAAVLITGPGAWSLDAAFGLTRRHSTTAGPAAARRAGQRSAPV